MLDYAVSLSNEGTIDLGDLPELSTTSQTEHAETSTIGVRDDGPDALLQALRAAQWNVSAVARQMGLARMTLYRRMKRAGIVPPNRMD